MDIVVLCGGLSQERDVSISTGTCAARALRERGHRVVLADLFFGRPEAVEDPRALYSREDPVNIYAVGEKEPDLAAVRARRGGRGLLGPGIVELCQAADITFLALHGGPGENGQLQACLDMYEIPYTGSGYLGSALAMDKEITKCLFAQEGISTPPGITLHRGDAGRTLPAFPCVVKPCSGGSSVGTSVVTDAAQYEDALSAAFACEDTVLVEQYIKGRELTVGIMDGRAMPVIEIIPRQGFYDYKNKYQAGLTTELCPAPLTPEETAQIQRLAEKVYRTLHLQAYARADFLMDGTGELYCLEANTLPGMTPTSLIPQMAAAEGMDYGALCERIIEVSMKKYGRGQL